MQRKLHASIWVLTGGYTSADVQPPRHFAELCHVVSIRTRRGGFFSHLEGASRYEIQSNDDRETLPLICLLLCRSSAELARAGSFAPQCALL
jgi:hypothetical protein